MLIIPLLASKRLSKLCGSKRIPLSISCPRRTKTHSHVDKCWYARVPSESKGHRKGCFSYFHPFYHIIGDKRHHLPHFLAASWQLHKALIVFMVTLWAGVNIEGRLW